MQATKFIKFYFLSLFLFCQNAASLQGAQRLSPQHGILFRAMETFEIAKKCWVLASVSADGSQIFASSAGVAKAWGVNEETGEYEEFFSYECRSESDKCLEYFMGFSPDGRVFATVTAIKGEGNTVHIWDRESQKELFFGTKVGAKITSVVFLKNGRFATLSHTELCRHEINIWDWKLGELFFTIPRDGWLWSIAFSLDESQLIETYNHWASIQNLCANNPLLELHNKTWMRESKFARHRNRFLTASESGEIKIWDLVASDSCPKQVTTLNHFGSLNTYIDELTAAALFPDGDHIISADRNGNIKIWSVEGRRLRYRMEDKNIIVNTFSFSSDNQTVAMGCHDGKVRIFSFFDQHQQSRKKKED